MAQLLHQLPGYPDDLVDGLHHVDGDADGAGLIGNGPADGLPDPPRGVGGELIALGIVELLHGLDKAQIALLDQIQKQHPTAHIPLGDRHHQTQVGLCQLLLGLLPLLHVLFQGGQLLLRDDLALLLRCRHTLLGGIAGGHGRGQMNLLIRRQQRHLADLLQVHPHGVVDVEAVHQRVGVHQLLFLDLGDLLQRRLPVIGQVRQELIAAHLDAQIRQRIVDAVQLVAVQIHGIHHVRQLAGVQLPGLAALGQQILQFLVCGDEGRRRKGGNGLIVQLLAGFGVLFLPLGGILRQKLVGHGLQILLLQLLIQLLTHACFPP